MFEIGTTEHWWEIAKRYPVLSNHSGTLKPLGYAHIVNLIESFKPKRILEVGHGGGSYLFEMFKDKAELWGLDDTIEDNRVLVNALEKLKKSNPHVKFVTGLLGNNIKELPDNYFDMVCSASVIEHIPHSNLQAVFEETKRILKPGGIVTHSYDIHYTQNTKAVFDAYVNSDFEWLKPRETMNLFWENWLNTISFEQVKELLKIIMFENAINVAEVYMWQHERNVRPTPQNWLSILTAARKPFQSSENYSNLNIDKKIESEKKLIPQTVSPENFNEFTYSKNRHFKFFSNKKYDVELLNTVIDPLNCDLSTYNSLLVYSFIKENVEKGSKILELEGKNPILFNSLQNDFVYWDLVKTADSLYYFTKEQREKLNIVYGEINNVNKDLADNSFDFIFSTSNLTYDDPKIFDIISGEIKRLLKPGGLCLLSFVALWKEPTMVSQDLMKYFFNKEIGKNEFVPYLKIIQDKDLFFMSEKCFDDKWKSIIGKNYISFGKPFSYSILFTKK